MSIVDFSDHSRSRSTAVHKTFQANGAINTVDTTVDTVDTVNTGVDTAVDTLNYLYRRRRRARTVPGNY